MRLTQRDKELFKNLMKHGVLSTNLIAQIQFKNCSKKALLRRLNILEKAGLIKRTLHHAELIWTLTHSGAVTIDEPKSLRTRINMNSIEHDLLLLKVKFRLEEFDLTENWQLEHCLRNKILSQKGFVKKENLILPDGLCIINQREQKESLAVELELNQKDKRRYEKIFRSYQEKTSLFGVWYLVKNQRLGFHLKQIWQDVMIYDRGVHFMFSPIDEVLDNPRQAPVYVRDKEHKIEEVFECHGFSF